MSFHSIIFTISVGILCAGLPLMLTTQGRVRLVSAIICAISAIGIVYGDLGLLKENGLLASGQVATGQATGGGGTGGSNAGGGGGGAKAPGGNGGTIIEKQYNNYNQPFSTPPLLENQLTELNALQAFIGSKTEDQLRDMFDFPNILKFNAQAAKLLMDPKSLTASQSSAIDNYFTGGTVLVRAREIRVLPGGAKVLMENWGTVFGVRVSKQYLNNKQGLYKYESSADLPKSVRDTVNGFDDTLDIDAILIIDVLNYLIC